MDRLQREWVGDFASGQIRQCSYVVFAGDRPSLLVEMRMHA